MYSEENEDWSKNDKDWFAILGGEDAPDADPEIAKGAKALRATLLIQQNRRHLPPLRLPEPPKPPPQHIMKWWRQPSYAIATSVLALFLLTPIIYYQIGWFPNKGTHTSPPEGEREKSYPFLMDDIKVPNPQEEAAKFSKELEDIGVEMDQKQSGDVWEFQFRWQPSQTQALAEILARYNQKLPANNNQAILYIQK